VSAENVEVVRGCFEALERALDTYWREPRPIVRALDAGDLAPEWEEWLEYLDPDVEWKTVFLGTTFRGHRECLGVWDDFIRRAGDYRVALEEVEDLGGDRVFCVAAFAARGKDSSARMDGHFYNVLTLRGGTVARLEEYTTREEALEVVRP
jgi:ketosteroid isomerase-like protein